MLVVWHTWRECKPQQKGQSKAMTETKLEKKSFRRVTLRPKRSQLKPRSLAALVPRLPRQMLR